MTIPSAPTSPEDSTPDLRSALEQQRTRRRRSLLIAAGAVVGVGAVIGAAALGASLLGGSATADAAGGAATEERLSITIAGSGESEFQDAIELVAEEQGLDVEWVNFENDWVLPNSSLVAGEVDANAFQHIAFLSAFNVANDADLTPVFSTVITQWGIFSSSIDDLDALEQGDRVVIPDDASNGGRALFILEDAGLIELSDDAGVYPTVDDVTGNELGLEFVPVQATTIPQQYDDPSIAAVVVGTSYFDPSQGVTKDDALFLDDSLADSSLPYVNVVATRADNLDDPAFEILQEVYQDERVAAGLDADSFGNSVLVDVSVNDLRERLAELEDFARELQ